MIAEAGQQRIHLSWSRRICPQLENARVGLLLVLLPKGVRPDSAGGKSYQYSQSNVSQFLLLLVKTRYFRDLMRLQTGADQLFVVSRKYALIGVGWMRPADAAP